MKTTTDQSGFQCNAIKATSIRNEKDWIKGDIWIFTLQADIANDLAHRPARL